MVLDLPPTAPLEDVVARLRELHEAYRAEYPAYYERHATPDSPAMRGADPAIVLVPGVGMFSFGANKQTARVAGEFYVNAINVMRGAEALSTYAPIAESEKFRIEYWALEEAKLRADAEAEGRSPPGSRSSPAAARASAGPSPIRLAAEGACVVVADIAARQRRGRRRRDRRAGRRARRACDVTDEAQVAAAIRDGVARVRRRRPRREQRRPVDLEVAARHDGRRLGPPARRHGPRLVPRRARGRPGHARPGHGRRHRLHRQQERVLRRPEQRRLRRGEGRPGPPGPPPRRGARAVRDPGQRRQPRRRRPRLGHLRQGLGRGPRRDLRHRRRRSSASSTRSGPC